MFFFVLLRSNIKVYLQFYKMFYQALNVLRLKPADWVVFEVVFEVILDEFACPVGNQFQIFNYPVHIFVKNYIQLIILPRRF